MRNSALLCNLACAVEGCTKLLNISSMSPQKCYGRSLPSKKNGACCCSCCLPSSQHICMTRPPRISNWLQLIDNQDLINTVLDAGKLGVGKLEVKATPIVLHDVLQRVWAISSHLISEKGLKNYLKIKKDISLPNPSANGNHVQILILLSPYCLTACGSVRPTVPIGG